MFISLALAHTVVDCYGGVWPMFKKSAELDLFWAGVISTVALFVGAGLQPLFGLWADHGHQRRFVIIGTSLSALGMGMGVVGVYQHQMGPTVTYALLFGVMLLVRIGGAMYHPSGASLAGNLSGARRSTMLATFIGAGMFGWAFSHGLFSKADQWTGGHTYWLLIPAAGVVLLAAVWCRPAHASERKPVALRDALATLVRLRRRLIALFFVQMIVSAVMLGIIFLMPELLEYKGYDAWLVNGGGTFFWIMGAVVFMIPAAQLADKIGRRRVLLIIIATGSALYYVTVLPPQLPTPVLCLLLLAAGGCIATTNPLGVSLGQQMAPHHASVISGVLMGLAWACSAWAPALVGYLGRAENLHIVGALCVMGVFMCAALPIALFIPADEPTSDEHVELEADLAVPLSVGVEDE